MIEVLKGLPADVAGFKATGEVTKADYENVVLPQVNEKVNRYDELNYLMLIETPLGEWTAGAWMKDMMLGLQKLTKWNKVAILTDSPAANKVTDMVSPLVPGEYRGFRTSQLQDAVSWMQ